MKKNLKAVVSFVLIFVFCVSNLFSVIGNAVSQREIDALQQERDALTAQEEAQQQIIDQLTDTKALFVERKFALDQKIEINKQEIEIIRQQVELYNGLVAEKEIELETARSVENQQTELLRIRMRSMEEKGTLAYIAFLLDADNLTDFLTRISDVSDIMHYDKALEEAYADAREDVQEIKASYEQTLSEQENLISELEAKQEQLEAQIEAAYTMIANIDELASDAQAEYDAIDAAKAEADAKINALLEELRKQKEAEAAAEAARREQEAQANANANTGGNSQTTESGNSSGTQGSSGNTGYSGNTGSYGSTTGTSGYIWPCPSCTLITSGFGGRTSPTAGATSNHGGLDVGAQAGATIISAQAGTVIYAGLNGGYGNCVMVDHGGGNVTLYAHMDSIATSYGASVAQGQVIGYVGSTGIVTGPHLHFEIRINGTQVDPAAYFGGLTYYG